MCAFIALSLPWLPLSTDNDDLHVEVVDLWIVQFSHFSVKEFLTSSCIATTSGEVSNYHIDMGPAHMILAQACLGVLLQVQEDAKWHAPNHPLA